MPSSEALAALYQQLGGARPQGAPSMDASYGQQVPPTNAVHRLLSLLQLPNLGCLWHLDGFQAADRQAVL